MTGFTNDALKALRRHRWAIFAVLTIGYFFVYFHRISVSVVGQDIVADVGGSIGILSSDFHIFRAMKIAETEGCSEPRPIAAPSDSILFLHLCVRECAAILKDHILGNISLL